MMRHDDSGQVPDSLFFKQLDLCCLMVAEKLGEGNIQEWTNGHYIRLSRLLMRETKIHLSENTLKRIFGKVKTSGRYHPQKATRDALARFIGYSDWDTFADENQLPVKRMPAVHSPVESRQGRIILKWTLIGAIVVAGLFLVFTQLKPDPFLKSRLICRNAEGLNPHTAIFQLSVPRIKPGARYPFIIDFADGEQPQKIVPGQLLTHYYERPGRYYALLRYGDHILDTVPVYLKTGGWTATAYMPHDTTRVYPLEEYQVIKSGRLEVNTAELFKAGIDTNHTFFVEFNQTIPSRFNGDDFELSAKIKTSETRAGVRCSQVIVRIFGDRARHAFTLMRPGCESWMYAYLSENKKEGESADLTNLAADLRQGGLLRVINQDRNVSISLNGKQIYRVNYTQPIGRIYGIQFSFTGIGTVQEAVLKDGTTGLWTNLLQKPGLANSK